MADRAPYPDIESAVVDMLVDLVAGCDHIDTVTPADLQDVMPYIRVMRTGGPDDGFTDNAVVAIDTFAATRDASRTLAEAIRQRLTTPTTPVTSGVKFDWVTTATGPNEVPWADDQTVRRFAAVYHVPARRTPA